jgi:hypothetical protein
MFRCNSGTYIDGFTFAGLKASGVRGGYANDNDPVYGLPASQGWVAGFYPGAIIRKSPYINNSTSYNDSGINNAAFDPNNYSGTGGDTTSAPTGGGIIVDGSLPDVTSPLRSFVINEFTQVCLDGPGLLVCNNGYAQAVSFFGLFCHYHAKALSGGQINMEVGTTDFGRYGLIADGKSTTPIFTATSNGGALAAAVTFAINAPSTGAGWFGDANRPAINMLAEVTVSGTTYIYPILNSSVNGAGWNVTISRPNPSNRAQNLGLDVTVPSDTQWRFYLRSMVSTASHTMEYAGSGTDYTALPENGGVPNETNESINRNGGRVWLTSTDQSGKFKVGDTFAVDQQTGFVTIDPQSVATNVVSDLTPELGGDLDVLTRNIYSSVGPVKFVTSSLERARIDSSGRLLVGTSTARSNFFGTTLSSAVQIEGTGGAASRGAISVINDDVSNNPPYVLLGRSGAATLGSNAAVVNGSRLGTLTFHGADGTNFIEAATVAGEVDGSPGTNDMPGRLVFSTTKDGASAPLERLRLDSNGELRFKDNEGPASIFLTPKNYSNPPAGEYGILSYYCTNIGTAQRCFDIAALEPVWGSFVRFSTTLGGNSTTTEAMRINPQQELLIGYTSDNGAYKLQVNSQIFATSSTVATSDGRYKENVATLGGCVDLVKALRPVSFTWKTQDDITRTDEDGNNVLVREGHNFPEGTQVGFIAQEVQEVLAEQPWLASVIKQNMRPAVTDADGNELAPEEEFFGIAEGNLIAVLTSALRETIAKIETLEARLTAAGIE